MGLLLCYAMAVHEQGLSPVDESPILPTVTGAPVPLQPAPHLQQQPHRSQQIPTAYRGWQAEDVVIPQKIQSVLVSQHQHGAGGGQVLKEQLRRLIPSL